MVLFSQRGSEHREMTRYKSAQGNKINGVGFIFNMTEKKGPKCHNYVTVLNGEAHLRDPF